MTSAFVQKSFKVFLHTFFCNPMRPNTEKSHQQLGSIENLSFSSSFFFSFPAKVKYILQSKECPRIGMHLGNSVQDYYFQKCFHGSLIFFPKMSTHPNFSFRVSEHSHSLANFRNLWNNVSLQHQAVDFLSPDS